MKKNFLTSIKDAIEKIDLKGIKELMNTDAAKTIEFDLVSLALSQLSGDKTTNNQDFFTIVNLLISKTKNIDGNTCAKSIFCYGKCLREEAEQRITLLKNLCGKDGVVFSNIFLYPLLLLAKSTSNDIEKVTSTQKQMVELFLNKKKGDAPVFDKRATEQCLLFANGQKLAKDLLDRGYPLDNDCFDITNEEQMFMLLDYCKKKSITPPCYG